MCTCCCVNVICYTECVRAFVSEKLPSLNNLLTSLSFSIHGRKRSFSLTAVGLCIEFPLFSFSADQSICPSSVEQRCCIWNRDKTNRTNALPPEHGVTYIGKSLIKSQKESLSLEESEIPSPPGICRAEQTKGINRPRSCGSQALKIRISILLTNATQIEAVLGEVLQAVLQNTNASVLYTQKDAGTGFHKSGENVGDWEKKNKQKKRMFLRHSWVEHACQVVE